MAGCLMTTEGVFNWMHRSYEKSLSWALRHQGIMLTLTLSRPCDQYYFVYYRS